MHAASAAPEIRVGCLFCAQGTFLLHLSLELMLDHLQADPLREQVKRSTHLHLVELPKSGRLIAQLAVSQEFVSQITFELKEIMDLLLQVQNEGSRYNVSCAWARQNVARWTTWVPVSTNCYEGFGLADDQGVHVQTRAWDEMNGVIWDAGHDPESQNLVDIVGGRFMPLLRVTKQRVWAAACLVRAVWVLASAMVVPTLRRPLFAGLEVIHVVVLGALGIALVTTIINHHWPGGSARFQLFEARCH
eukprot:g28416.t1